MKIELDLANPVTDDIKMQPLCDEMEKGAKIYIYRSEEQWDDDGESNVFGVWLEYGDTALMFDTALDDLEMFAASLTKSIEMLRRDYADVIKDRIKKGHVL